MTPTLSRMTTSETKLAGLADEIEINVQAMKSTFKHKTPAPVVAKEAPIAAPVIEEATKIVEEPAPGATEEATDSKIAEAAPEVVAKITAEPEAVIEKVAAAEPIVEAEATAGEVVTEATPGVVEEPTPVAAKKAVVTVVATVVTAIVSAKERPAATEPPVKTAR